MDYTKPFPQFIVKTAWVFYFDSVYYKKSVVKNKEMQSCINRFKVSLS